MMDDQKLIEQLQNDLESYEHDTQELKRKNEELQQKLTALLQKEQKSEALRSQLESLISAGDGDDDLSDRLRALLREFKSGDVSSGKCVPSILDEIFPHLTLLMCPGRNFGEHTERIQFSRLPTSSDDGCGLRLDGRVYWKHTAFEENGLDGMLRQLGGGFRIQSWSYPKKKKKNTRPATSTHFHIS